MRDLILETVDRQVANVAAGEAMQFFSPSDHYEQGARSRRGMAGEPGSRQGKSVTEISASAWVHEDGERESQLCHTVRMFLGAFSRKSEAPCDLRVTRFTPALIPDYRAMIPPVFARGSQRPATIGIGVAKRGHLERGFQSLDGIVGLGVHDVQEGVPHVFPPPVQLLHPAPVLAPLCTAWRPIGGEASDDQWERLLSIRGASLCFLDGLCGTGGWGVGEGWGARDSPWKSSLPS